MLNPPLLSLPKYFIPSNWQCSLLAGLLFCFCCAVTQADEVVLDNGMQLSGQVTPLMALTKKTAALTETAVPGTNMLMIEDGIKRTYVPSRKANKPDVAVDFQINEIFRLPQSRTGRQQMVASLGLVSAVKPFDQFGRRTVQLNTPTGPLDVIQGITEITPKYVRVTALTHDWSFSMSTDALPLEQIDAILRQVTDNNDPNDRMSIARFYLQGGHYSQSRQELGAIRQQFPEFKAVADEVINNLYQVQAQQLLDELNRRRNAGQHQLAQVSLTKFPTEKLDPVILRQLQEMASEYEQQKNQIDQIQFLLENLQAQLSVEHQAQVAPMRLEVSDQLDFDTLARLTPFFSFASDDTIPVEERLSLAFSGWMLGSAHAITDLNQTIRFWEARFLVIEYLRSADEIRRDEITRQLKMIEGIGPGSLLELVPQLPLPLFTNSLEAGVAHEVEVSSGVQKPDTTRYSVLLPTEYNPHRAYPLVIALRPTERSIEETLLWWGGDKERPGQSQRQGYIVVSPEYLNEGDRDYMYNLGAHQVVEETLRDVRKRFQIDSDRVFLAGHGAGANAALDIGMSHPHHFAGVISINGINKNFGQWYWRNCKNLPLYFVAGELDRALLVQNAGIGQVNEMMRKRYDVMYTEYVGRGYESYHEELRRIFDWMDLMRRVQFPAEFEVQILRPTDDEFYWVQAGGFPEVVQHPEQVLLASNRTRRINPMRLSAKYVPSSNVIQLQSGAKNHTLLLSPELVDFDRRLRVRRLGRHAFNDFIESDIRVILDDLRQRGDRQKIYTAQISID